MAAIIMRFKRLNAIVVLLCRYGFIPATWPPDRLLPPSFRHTVDVVLGTLKAWILSRSLRRL